jgi:hypothetical protein
MATQKALLREVVLFGVNHREDASNVPAVASAILTAKIA